MTTTLRFGGYQSSRSVHTRAARVLGRALERELGERVRFELTANVTDTGRKAADLFDLVEGDALDLCYFSSAWLAGRVPELAAFDLPFEIGDRARAYALQDGALGLRLCEAVAARTGFRLLAFWDNGIRHISNRVRPIRRPEDCRGIRLRTQDNALQQEAFRALGFEPVMVDVRDLPAAVAEGRVDAQENPLTNLVNFGMYEHHPHVTLSAHLFGVALVLANRARHDAWPEPVRAGLAAALAEATAAQRGFAEEDDTVCMARLDEAGNQVVTLSEAEREAFAAKVAPVVDAAKRRLDPELLRLLDADG